MTVVAATTSRAWSLRLPAKWPSQGAHQWYLAMRRDPDTKNACAAAERMQDDVNKTPCTAIGRWLRGDRTPDADSRLRIEALWGIEVRAWTLPATETVKQTLKRLEAAA